jgi:hypothetical protein
VGEGTPTDGDFSGWIMEEGEEAALTNRGRNDEGRGEGEAEPAGRHAGETEQGD